VAGAGIEIRGAADRRQSLLDRLARAKAEGAASPPKPDAAETTPPAQAENGHTTGGGRAAELREKLLADRKQRQLREQLLARKRARSAVAAAAQDVKARASTTPGKSAASASPIKGDSTPANTGESTPANNTAETDIAPGQGEAAAAGQ
jgi:hypothetical protein